MTQTKNTHKQISAKLKHYDMSETPSLSLCFSVACALYWYCADYHGGMNDPLYSILSTLQYSPGAFEDGTGDNEPDTLLYRMLESGELLPVELYAWFNVEWPMAKLRDEQ